jgi:hypothetical protein
VLAKPPIKLGAKPVKVVKAKPAARSARAKPKPKAKAEKRR